MTRGVHPPAAPAALPPPARGAAARFLPVAAAVALTAASALPAPWLALPAALALVAFVPGFALLGFVRLPCSRFERAVLGALVSVCVTTVAVQLAGTLCRRADPAFMRAVVGAAAVACALLEALFAKERRAAEGVRVPAATWAVLGVCLAFALATTFLAHAVTADNWHLTLKDNSKYLYIIPELQQHIPPRNVFFSLEASQPLGYYYFLHLAMAMLANIGGVSVTAAFAAGCLAVTALSLLVPFVLARALFGECAARWATALRTFIGGFDWIPYCLLYTIDLARRGEPWSWLRLTFCDEQWNAWFGARVIVPLTHHWWFPQHELALLLSLAWAVFFFRKPTARLWFAVMPFLLVMMAGCSVYYTLAAVPAYGIYILAQAARRRYAAAACAFGSGCAALLLSLPYLGELRVAAARASGGLSFGIVQSQRYPHEWFGCAFFEYAAGADGFTRLMDLPLNYFLEYGLYAIGLAGFAWQARRTRWRPEAAHRFLFCLAGCAFVLATFVRAKQGCNEFGYHAHQAPLAVAILLTGAWLAARSGRRLWRPWQAALLAFALLISLAETHWAVRWWWMGNILSPPAASRHPVAEMAKAVKGRLPPDAVIQGIPSFDGIYRPQRHYLGRAVIADTFDAAAFVRDPARFNQAYGMIVNGFATPDPAQAHALFSRLGVSHVIVGEHEADFLKQRLKSDEGLKKFADTAYFTPVYVAEKTALYALRPAETGTPAPRPADGRR